MSFLQQKIKINNSYESEPSSGSGSPLGENHDCRISDDDNMNLPYLLKPNRFSSKKCENKSSIEKFPVEKSLRIIEEETGMQYGVPLHSSQESSFEGFSDSSFGKLQKAVYHKEEKSQKVVNPSHLAVAESDMVRFPSLMGKTVFTQYYDTIVEENSCNAVDLKISEESTSQLSFNKDLVIRDSINPSIELSFNGKIKCMSVNTKESATESAYNESSYSCKEMPIDIHDTQKSPDLFFDDDEENDVEKEAEPSISISNGVSNDINATVGPEFVATARKSVIDFQQLKSCERDEKLLQRIRKCLAGVPPPPSFTIPQLDMFQAVSNRRNEILNFLSSLSKEKGNTVLSLFKPTHSVDEIRNMAWREIRDARQHGLCYNLSQASENVEYLSLSVIERFIGAETASSYRNSPSSAKKRNTRVKLLTQSPGSRLSHLAKRRAIFSSAHLATTSQKCNNLFGPQIIVDKRKLKNRRKGTPKRKTPGSKRKNRKTPTSSARKRLFRTESMKSGPSRETLKRALFQSPAKQQTQTHLPSIKLMLKPEVANRVEKSKRALFSPDQQLPNSKVSLSLMERDSSGRLESLLKRKRYFDDQDADVELTAQNSKLFCSGSKVENLTPRALKIKSQSFCVASGANYSTGSVATAAVNNASSSSKFKSLSGNVSLLSSSSSNSGFISGNIRGDNTNNLKSKIQRAHSDMTAQSNSLTENQRKKLLWAVSQALQEKKVSTKHESFKQYATVLARVVRRIFQEYYQKSSTSNSETMLRLAKKYVFNVISGRNADDVYFQAKSQHEDARCLTSTRVSGYIAPDEYRQRQSAGKMTKAILNFDNSMDSLVMCQPSSQASLTHGQASSVALSIQSSQSSLLDLCSQSSDACQSKTVTKTTVGMKTHHLPIQPNPVLENSSSKSNLGGLVLRENVDCEQRRSAQKNFTGKDQRNVSPYATYPIGSLSSGVKLPMTQYGNFSGLSQGAKVKRQISFDT